MDETNGFLHFASDSIGCTLFQSIQLTEYEII